MRLSRRNLLKLAGTTTTAAMALNLGISISDVSAETVKLRTLEAKETPSICTFCSVGCGIIAQTVNGKMIHTEGDPDNPNNQGSLCSKGAAALQMSTNDQRVRQVLYRAPGANAWENRSWEWAIKRIAELTKKTRDESFQLFNSEGTMVSRTDAIGSLGSSMINNEDLYLISKFARGIGVTYLEHQARLCHSSTVGGLAPTFGRGAMTNHWQDMKNTHVALICGSNAAENHPVAMKWLQKARDNNKAKIIHVDPRFTRTSAYSDLYCPIRSGTNIAFYSGMMHYILENERYHKEYLIHYTNAASLIDERYSFDEVTGLFNGFDEASASYKQKNTWDYQRDEEGNVLKDETLQHPRSVFQIMKKHYARYTLEKTAAACGAPQDKLEQVYDLYTSTGQAGKAGTILYAMGQTQFTSGSQNIRSMGVIQLLLGNIGIPGGGVNALRGHSNVQGSTDMGLLFHYLPGYMPAPEDNLKTLAEYNATTPAAPAYWSNRPKFITSQLKSWWGDAATPENDFAYGWIPKRKAGKNHSHIAMFEDMLAGNVKGLYCWGQNPVVAGSDSKLESKALENLDWLVCMDPFETETSTFWKRPGANPSEIGTEVFLLPAATFLEKDGTITNSGRVIQYRWKTVDGQGAVKPEFYALDHIVKRLKVLYANSARPEDEPIKKLTWNYGNPDDQEAYIDAVMREINGRDLTTGKLVSGFGELKDDGTTDGGVWIFSGMYTETHGNRTQSRRTEDVGGWGNYLDWGYAWPANRRNLYNRASADPSGKPWTEDRRYIWWDGSKWTGYDVPDFVVNMSPDDPLGKKPFIMQTDREGRLFAIQGLNDGPLPEHYEPWESPTTNAFHGGQSNPAMFKGAEGSKSKGTPEEYPIICSTWRVCEHWHTGATTRNMPWLAELMPSNFVEISEELANEKSIKNGEIVEIASARGEIKAYAMVTKRANVFMVNGKKVHQVGMPWHYGYNGLVTGEITNTLTPHVGDANTAIPEYKVFLVDVRKVM